MRKLVELEWVSPKGEQITLIGKRARYDTAFVVEGGIEGFVGVFEDADGAVPGLAGRVFRLADREVSPIAGTLTISLMGECDCQWFYRLWSTRRCGVLRLTVGESFAVLPCRLSAPIPAPVKAPRAGSTVTVTLIADGGAWLLPHTGTGEVRVINDGDIPIAAKIRWKGAGGVVRLPSSATLTLPPAAELREYSFDPRSTRVYDLRGIVDHELSKKISPISELVPISGEGAFSLPSGAELLWDVGVFNPWM